MDTSRTLLPEELAHPERAQAELAQAGAVVDKAIGFLLDKKLPPIAVASALLGGALGLLAREMSDGAILRVLDNAAQGVRNGDLREPAAAEPPSP